MPPVAVASGAEYEERLDENIGSRGYLGYLGLQWTDGRKSKASRQMAALCSEYAWTLSRKQGEFPANDKKHVDIAYQTWFQAKSGKYAVVQAECGCSAQEPPPTRA